MESEIFEDKTPAVNARDSRPTGFRNLVDTTQGNRIFEIRNVKHLTSIFYFLTVHRSSLLITIFFVLFAHFSNAQTLQDYLNEASENNPLLKSKYAEFEASLKRVSQVNALPDPTLSFGLFISPIETRVGPQRAKVSLGQMFPWFGTLKAKEKVATLQTEIVYQEFLNSKNELHFKVKKAYYPLYEINQHIRLNEAYLEILETYKQLAITSISNGRASMTDVIRVDILIEDLKTDILLLKDQKAPYSIQFNRLLNKPDSSKIIINDVLPITPVDDHYRLDSVTASNPMLRAMESKIRASEASIEVAKKKGLPQFGVGLDYAFISKRTDLPSGQAGMNVPDNGKNAFMPMVSMTLPVFRGKYKAAVEEAQLTQTAMEFKKENLENTLFTSYEAAWFELNKARQLSVLYKDQMVRTEQMVELLYVGYSNSGKDFEEVLRMQQKLLKYQIALTSSEVKFHVALAQLDYITAKSE